METSSLQEHPSGDSDPLFLDSEIGTHEFHVAFMSLCQHHNLTYSSQSDILKLISMVIPTPNNVLSSAHVLRSRCVKNEEETVVHHFCGHCMDPIQGLKCTKAGCVTAMAPQATFV